MRKTEEQAAATLKEQLEDCLKSWAGIELTKTESAQIQICLAQAICGMFYETEFYFHELTWNKETGEVIPGTAILHLYPPTMIF